MEALMILATVQALIGAFDLIFHHEMTERLTWKASSATELKLHAVRNALYAVIFLVLAWAEPHGLLALAFVALLAVEIAVTLADFVIEDRTRLLPESERIVHTLLAVSYGVFLALFAPFLIAWAGEPTGLLLVERGAWSAVMSVFALGVALWALRDGIRSRVVALPTIPTGELVTPYLTEPRRILITGGTGFIGRRLTEALVDAGHHVTVLTRDPRKVHGMALPVRIATDLNSFGSDEIFDAVINLAGASVAAGRWTVKRKKTLRASRIDTTRTLVAFIGRLDTKPEVLISASAIGYYNSDSDRPMSEAATPAPGFAHDMCADCEAAARKACRYGVRVVELRLGLVLAAHGGPLGMMMPAFEFGLGARLGSGNQWMSWVHLDDVVAMMAFLISRHDLRGPFNAVAPVPVQNAAFSAALAHVLKRPCRFAVPAWLIRLVLGEMGQELLLASKRIQPARLCDAGFAFTYPGIEEALRVSLTPEPPSLLSLSRAASPDRRRNPWRTGQSSSAVVP